MQETLKVTTACTDNAVSSLSQFIVDTPYFRRPKSCWFECITFELTFDAILFHQNSRPRLGTKKNANRGWVGGREGGGDDRLSFALKESFILFQAGLVSLTSCRNMAAVM